MIQCGIFLVHSFVFLVVIKYLFEAEEIFRE